MEYPSEHSDIASGSLAIQMLLITEIISVVIFRISMGNVSLWGFIPPIKLLVPAECSRDTEILNLLCRAEMGSDRHPAPCSFSPRPSAELPLTKLGARVGGIQSLFVHAPVEDVAVPVVWVIDLGEIPGRIMQINLREDERVIK